MEQYHYVTADWREQLRKNHRRTRWVIGTFILLYVLVGLLLDTLWYTYQYHASVIIVLQALAQLVLIPYMTFILSAVAMISLLITFAWHDNIMLLGTAYHQVTADAATLEEKQLYNIVEELKIAASLDYMPRVFIIEAEYMNAFASGYSQKSSMVAISRGLLKKLDRDELQAVMAHEISHIHHLDIKLTLVVTVLSNIMLLIVDVLFKGIVYSRSNRRPHQGLAIFIVLLRYFLPIITWLLFLYLSRTREYMADAGSCALTRTHKPLASALIKIDEDYRQHGQSYARANRLVANEEIRRNAYIYDPVRDGKQFLPSADSIFSTHPKLSERLKAIGFTKRAST